MTKRNRTVMRQLTQLQEKYDKVPDTEKIDVGYEQIGLLVDAPAEVIDGLDARQVSALSRWIGALISGKAMPEDGDTGKNLERPGGETPPA
jgi:hypothetical protein